MNKIPYIPFAIAFAAAAVLAEEAENVASTETPVPTEERQDAGDSRWHFSIGARFAPGVKTRASMSRQAFSTLSRKMSFAGLESRETRSSTSVEESSSSLTESGTASSSDGRYEFDAGFIDMNDSAGVAGETWNWHLDSTATRTTTRTTTATSSLAVDLASEGTVSTWEMRLALQPSYRVTDWCEVRGTFGAVMTHVDVDVDSTVFVNRRMYRQVSSSDDGYVFAGLCGLDAVFSPCEWLDILVGADLRIGPNKWDFDTGLARGTAELPRATYRAGVGVRF